MSTDDFKKAYGAGRNAVKIIPWPVWALIPFAAILARRLSEHYALAWYYQAIILGAVALVAGALISRPTRSR